MTQHSDSHWDPLPYAGTEGIRPMASKTEMYSSWCQEPKNTRSRFCNVWCLVTVCILLFRWPLSNCVLIWGMGSSACQSLHKGCESHSPSHRVPALWPGYSWGLTSIFCGIRNLVFNTWIWGGNDPLAPTMCSFVALIVTTLTNFFKNVSRPE